MKTDAANDKRKRSLWTAAGIFLGRLRIAFRGLWKKPLITVSAIISIALGIGAATAMFTIYDEYLLRPLPVPEPGRLVNFSGSVPNPGSQFNGVAGDSDEIFSYPMFRELEKEQNVFTNIAAHRHIDVTITAHGVGTKEQGMLVSGGYFPALRLIPAIGRLLNHEDDKVTGEAHAVVLSYAYWQSRFGGDPGALNQTVTVNNRLMTIVGVAPRGFTGTTLGTNPRIFIPISMRGSALIPGLNEPDQRINYWLYLFGRLKPGVTLEQAATAINITYHSIVNQYDAPVAELILGADSPTMKQFREKQLRLNPGARGQSILFGSNKERLLIFMGGTLLLLIIACANVTNLLVARGMSRVGEMALRVSLGATRGQIIRQLLTESFALVFIAGIVGIFAAHGLLRLIVVIYPPHTADLFSFSLNTTALLFAALLTFAVGVVVGLFPAFHNARNDITPLLKEQAGQTTGSKSAARVRAALIIAQITLSLTLLAVSGLFAKSLYKLNNVALGLNPDNIVTFGVSPIQNGYTPQQMAQLVERLEEALAAIPGVGSVTSSWIPMFSRTTSGIGVLAEGPVYESRQYTVARIDVVGANYLGTLGMSLIAGRDFTREDTHETGRKAVIVNETFAEKFELGRDVVGKYVAVPYAYGLDYEIIGLVKNAKHFSVADEFQPYLFFPHSKFELLRIENLNFYVKTALPPNSVIPRVRDIVTRIDPTLPIENLTTMMQTIRNNTFENRFASWLAGAFAFLATLLTAVGLYGIFAYDVARRRREIGLRMALGATRTRLCLMFFRRAALITLIGGAIGSLLSIYAGRIIQSMLYKFEGFDTGVFLGAAALLFVIMTSAVLIPVCRAVMIEPLEALRDE